MSKIKAVSFDLDGTIVDFNYNIVFWQEEIPRLYAERHGVSIEEAKNTVFSEYKTIGNTDPRWHRPSFWFSKFDIKKDHRDLIGDLRHHLKIYPEVVPLINKIANSFELVIVTGNAEEFLDLKLDTEGISKFFKKRYSVVDHFNGVKTSDVYSAVAKDLGLSPEEIVHVGDEPRFDYLEPKKAGFHAFLLERGDQIKVVQDPQNMKHVNPHHVIKDLNELYRKVTELGL